MRLTPTNAQALLDDAAVRGKWLVWIVTATDLEYPGKVVARAHTAADQGGTDLPGALVANTLDALRTKIRPSQAGGFRASV